MVDRPGTHGPLPALRRGHGPSWHPDLLQWPPRWHRKRRRPLSRRENGQVTRVDLEAQLSHPSHAFKQLLAVWRLLPRDVAPPVSSQPPRKRQRAEDRLGPDGAAQLVTDYQAGRSTKWLQRTYKLSQGAVLRLLDVNGVPRRRQGLTEVQVEEAVQLYREGWSLTRIGDRFRKDHTVVRNALLRRSIELRY
jgi:hypothetical protein